jgi:hypothetical protein
MATYLFTGYQVQIDIHLRLPKISVNRVSKSGHSDYPKIGYHLENNNNSNNNNNNKKKFKGFKK